MSSHPMRGQPRDWRICCMRFFCVSRSVTGCVKGQIYFTSPAGRHGTMIGLRVLYDLGPVLRQQWWVLHGHHLCPSASRPTLCGKMQNNVQRLQRRLSALLSPRLSWASKQRYMASRGIACVCWNHLRRQVL